MRNACDNGGIIEEISFASFGYPKGVTCDSLVIDQIVHSQETMDVVKKYCLNKQGCNIPVNEDNFPLKYSYNRDGNDIGKVKQLAVKVVCSKPPELALNATIPLGTEGRVILPNKESIRSVLTFKPEVEKWVALHQDVDIEVVNDAITLKRTGIFRFKVNY